MDKSELSNRYVHKNEFLEPLDIKLLPMREAVLMTFSSTHCDARIVRGSTNEWIVYKDEGGLKEYIKSTFEEKIYVQVVAEYRLKNK